jgi:hypothetical protein
LEFPTPVCGAAKKFEPPMDADFGEFPWSETPAGQYFRNIGVHRRLNPPFYLFRQRQTAGVGPNAIALPSQIFPLDTYNK